MSALLEKRDSIYGVCAIWIVLFHVFRRISMPYIPVLTNIVSIGNMAVDIFFFLSGLCLCLSATKHDYAKKGWRMYFKRRLSRVLLPYFIICVPYYLWSAIFEISGRFPRRCIIFFANITSASFWLKGMQTTWYVYGILLFYVLFPAIYIFIKKNGILKKAALLLGMMLFAIISFHVPVLKNSMIVWARLPIFTIGVITGFTPDNEKASENVQTAIATIIVILLGWLTSLSELYETFTIPQVYKLLLFAPLSLALLTLFSRFGKRIHFLERVGTVSLEFYLVHITLLHPLDYYGAIHTLGNWLYIFLPAITIIISWVVGIIKKQILNKERKYESILHF